MSKFCDAAAGEDVRDCGDGVDDDGAARAVVVVDDDRDRTNCSPTVMLAMREGAAGTRTRTLFPWVRWGAIIRSNRSGESWVKFWCCRYCCSC